MKVDFAIIGAMKSGTSSLYEELRSHPGLVMSEPKEPQFFSDESDWKNNIEEYHSYFNTRNGAFYGEASTNYTKYPHFKLELWKDMYAYNPDMKLIYLMRHPVDRTISHYLHLLGRGFTSDKIEVAIKKGGDLLDTSRYYMQIEPFIRMFGEDQVLLINFHEFISGRNQVLEQVANFLEIDPSFFSGEQQIHKNKTLEKRRYHHYFDNPPKWLEKLGDVFPESVKKVIWNTVRSGFTPDIEEKPELDSKYRDIILRTTYLDTCQLEQLTGWDLAEWKE